MENSLAKSIGVFQLHDRTRLKCLELLNFSGFYYPHDSGIASYLLTLNFARVHCGFFHSEVLESLCLIGSEYYRNKQIIEGNRVHEVALDLALNLYPIKSDWEELLKSIEPQENTKCIHDAMYQLISNLQENRRERSKEDIEREIRLIIDYIEKQNYFK